MKTANIIITQNYEASNDLIITDTPGNHYRYSWESQSEHNN